MELKVGGIYSNSDHYNIIIEEDKLHYYLYHVFKNDLTHDGVINQINKGLQNKEYQISFVDKSSTYYTALDGYLGKIEEHQLNKLKYILRQKSWWKQKHVER